MGNLLFLIFNIFYMTQNYLQALAIMTGYIIGVGMLSLPYLFHKSGILAFFIFFLILIPVQYMIHLIYANMIIVTKEYHRMPGYAGMYLGKKSKGLVFFAKVFGNFGGLIAYIITTGIFLNELLHPIFGGNELIYATILFLLEALIIFFGIGMIARVELIMSGVLLFIVLLIAWKGWGVVDISNYNFLDWKYLLIPYGAMLFALDGNGALPIVVRLLDRDKASIKRVVRYGTMLPILVITIFVTVVVGITGGNTTPDALAGMKDVFNGGIISIALVFGIFTMVTSFLGVAESIRETLWWDFKVNKYMAWALAVFVPYVLYILGLKNLIGIISFAGAVAGGLAAIILILIFIKLKKQKEKISILKKDKLTLFKYHPHNFISYLLITLFICGIIYEIISFALN